MHSRVMWYCSFLCCARSLVRARLLSCVYAAVYVCGVNARTEYYIHILTHWGKTWNRLQGRARTGVFICHIAISHRCAARSPRLARHASANRLPTTSSSAHTPEVFGSRFSTACTQHFAKRRQQASPDHSPLPPQQCIATRAASIAPPLTSLSSTRASQESS